MTTQTDGAEAKPAPGPYEVGDDDELNGCPFIPIIAADRGCIAEVVPDYSEDRPHLGKRERATALLLVAAPELLREVIQCSVELREAANLIRDRLPGVAGIYDAAAQRAEMTAAKAKGR